jgi:putative membrane protein
LSVHRPRAFRLPQGEVKPETASPREGSVAVAPDNSLEALLEGEERGLRARARLPRSPRRPLIRFGAVLVSALGGLILLAIVTSIENFVVSLFAQNAWLGGIALLLAGVAGLALLGLILRELVTILRQHHIVALRRRGEELRQGRDLAAAARFVDDLAGLYAHRPDTAQARILLAGLANDVIDPSDRISIAERELIAPLDASARRLVAVASRRVAIVTAVSPRAVFDVVFVTAQSLWLIRRIAEVYGSRPGFLGLLALTRRVVSHLAVTGGMAAGDSLVQQVLGHGIASRLSARFGEGALNGLLTARVGLAAISACRPLPFVAVKAPRITDVAAFLLRRKDRESRGRDGG